MSKLKEDKVPGGLAAGMTLNDIAKKHGISVDLLVAEFKKGIGVEMEHTSDREVAKEITLDHLFEDPKYYTKLIDMEKNPQNEANLFEFLRPSDVDSKMKELGISKIPLSSQAERVLKGMVKEKFLDKVTNSERLIYFVESLGKEKFGYGSKGKPLSPLVDRFWNDISSEAIYFGGKMAAYQVAMNIKDMKANGEEIDSPYEMMKEYFKNFGMDHSRSRVFDSALRNLGEWMKRNKIEESKDGLERVAQALPQTEEEPVNEGYSDEIIQQLGGNRFIAMTGAKNFIKNDSKREVVFQLPKAKNGIKYVRITLTSMDVYNVDFISARGTNIKVVASEKGVYNDKLPQIFTKHTGLYTRL